MIYKRAPDNAGCRHSQSLFRTHREAWPVHDHRKLAETLCPSRHLQLHLFHRLASANLCTDRTPNLGIEYPKAGKRNVDLPDKQDGSRLSDDLRDKIR
jgi:hypothetical protein